MDITWEKLRLANLFKLKYGKSNIKVSEMYNLIYLLQTELEKHADNGNLCMYIPPINSFIFKMITDKGITYKGFEIKISSHYFKGRECVNFYQNGGISFCNWASDVNSEPILKAFRKWIEII